MIAIHGERVKTAMLWGKGQERERERERVKKKTLFDVETREKRNPCLVALMVVIIMCHPPKWLMFLFLWNKYNDLVFSLHNNSYLRINSYMIFFFLFFPNDLNIYTHTAGFRQGHMRVEIMSCETLT